MRGGHGKQQQQQQRANTPPKMAGERSPSVAVVAADLANECEQAEDAEQMEEPPRSASPLMELIHAAAGDLHCATVVAAAGGAGVEGARGGWRGRAGVAGGAEGEAGRPRQLPTRGRGGASKSADEG